MCFYICRIAPSSRFSEWHLLSPALPFYVKYVHIPEITSLASRLTALTELPAGIVINVFFKSQATLTFITLVSLNLLNDGHFST
jgi:hypothetical protein